MPMSAMPMDKANTVVKLPACSMGPKTKPNKTMPIAPHVSAVVRPRVSEILAAIGMKMAKKITAISCSTKKSCRL